MAATKVRGRYTTVRTADIAALRKFLCITCGSPEFRLEDAVSGKPRTAELPPDDARLDAVVILTRRTSWTDAMSQTSYPLSTSLLDKLG